MKNITLLLFAFFIVSACGKPQANNPMMDIRYTSINDYYAHFVFNLEDNIHGIKILNDYTIEYLDDAKHYRDSVRAELEQMSETDRASFLEGQSLPLRASDFVFYNPPQKGNWGKPGIDDLIITYIVDPDCYMIKDIRIPSKEVDNEQNSSIVDIITMPTKTQFDIQSDTLTIGILAAVKSEIDRLEYHHRNSEYQYEIINSMNNNLMIVLFYTSNGKFLNFDYGESNP